MYMYKNFYSIDNIRYSRKISKRKPANGRGTREFEPLFAPRPNNRYIYIYIFFLFKNILQIPHPPVPAQPSPTLNTPYQPITTSPPISPVYQNARKYLFIFAHLHKPIYSSAASQISIARTPFFLNSLLHSCVR